MIGLPLHNPTGIPYPNGDVASVIPASFQKMMMGALTWTVHNNMEEAEGDTETGVRESDRHCPRSGQGEGWSRWLSSQIGYQTSDIGGASCEEVMEKDLPLGG